MGYISKATLDALRVQFEAKFQEAFEATSAWASELATEVPSDGESNLYGWAENSVEIAEWIGERDMSVLEESDYRLTNRHFQGGIKLNRDKIADDKLGIFTSITIPMFAQRVAKFDDSQLSGILLNNATAYDGEQFFDPNHGNSTSSALDANGVAFAAARAILMSFTDPGGQPRYVGDQFTLVVGPALERTARIVVEAEFNSYGVVGTDGAAHATNVQKGMASVLVVPELVTNPNRWFLFATGLPVKALVMQKRQQPEFVSIENKSEGGRPFTHNENVYGVDFRSEYGVSFPWLAVANDPDAAMT
jgi:phage major head subunit gpT-like protein